VRASLDNSLPFKPKEANVAAKRETLNRRREFETNTRNEQLLSRIYKILTVRSLDLLNRLKEASSAR
jgi:hypothetical protein